MKKEERAEDRSAFADILNHEAVMRAARAVRTAGAHDLVAMLELGRAIAEATGDAIHEKMLRAELSGYDAAELEVPPERRVVGFASPFPVRAIGLLDPEEIFLANREKFSQVTLTIGQPVAELQSALEQIQQGGVLGLKVPASEVSAEAAATEDDTEVYIYILPREIERVVNAARRKSLDVLVAQIVDAILGEEEPTPAPEPAKAEKKKSDPAPAGKNGKLPR